ncbi:MAG: hypothetical protein ACOCRO_03625 [Halanaerobiales bacterium]
MPVIPQINEAFKIGLNYTPDAPPEIVSVVKGGAEGAMSGMGLIPAGPIMIPVIPFGVVLSIALSKLEAMLFSGNELASKQAGKLLKIYNEQLAKAKAQRKAAVDKLYEDEKEAKAIIVAEYESIIAKIEENKVKIEELNKKYTAQIAEYLATIGPFAENAKKADEAGNEKEKQKWQNEVVKYDPWYEDIQMILVDIVQLQLDNILLQMEADRLEPITKLAIKKDWVYMESIASLLDVPVPFYPDLPAKPNLPQPSPTPQEPCWVKALRQIFAKWLAAPMVPPIGLAVAATLEMVRCFIPNNPPPVAAVQESGADALKNFLGGIV